MSELPADLVRLGDRLSDLCYHDLACELVEKYEALTEMIEFCCRVVDLSFVDE